MKLPLTIALVFAVTVPVGTAQAIDTVAPNVAPTVEAPWIADYEGETLDLRFGWDTARACFTDGDVTECWDTEAEMLDAVPALRAPSTGGAIAGASGMRRASCSSYLRLYTGANYTGSVLALATQSTLMNLSSYGFNNVTSSYRVGGCSSALYDLSNGGAPLYGGATWAWAESASMNAGWDNRVSSVYIA